MVNFIFCYIYVEILKSIFVSNWVLCLYCILKVRNAFFTHYPCYPWKSYSCEHAFQRRICQLNSFGNSSKEGVNGAV